MPRPAIKTPTNWAGTCSPSGVARNNIHDMMPITIEAIAITKNHFGALFQIVAVTLLPASLIISFFSLVVMPPISFPAQPEEIQAVVEVLKKYWPVIAAMWLVLIVAAIVAEVGLALWAMHPKPIAVH